MALILEEGFEGGSDGADLTTANSLADATAGSGPALKFTSAIVADGVLAARVTSISTEYHHARFPHAAGSDVWISVCVRWVGTLPTANAYFLGSWAGTNKIADLRINPDATITARDNNLAALTSSVALVPDQWYRISYHIVPNTAGGLTLRIYDSPTATTPVFTGSADSTRAFQADHVRIGTLSAAEQDLVFDRLLVDDTTEPAGLPGAPAASPFKTWDGSGYVDLDAYTWDGSTYKGAVTATP